MEPVKTNRAKKASGPTHRSFRVCRWVSLQSLSPPQLSESLGGANGANAIPRAIGVSIAGEETALGERSDNSFIPALLLILLSEGSTNVRWTFIRGR